MDNKTINIPRFKHAIRALRLVASGIKESLYESIDTLSDDQVDIINGRINELREAAKVLENYTEGDHHEEITG